MTSSGTTASADVCKGLSNTICGLFRCAQDVRLPNPHHRPTCSLERALVLIIARNVSPHLRNPVCGIVAPTELGDACFKIAAMPEIAIAEDDDALSREYDVRDARQSGNVEAISKASTPEFATQGKLASRVRFPAGTPSRRRGTLRRWSKSGKGRCAALPSCHRCCIIPGARLLPEVRDIVLSACENARHRAGRNLGAEQPRLTHSACINWTAVEVPTAKRPKRTTEGSKRRRSDPEPPGFAPCPGSLPQQNEHSTKAPLTYVILKAKHREPGAALRETPAAVSGDHGPRTYSEISPPAK